MILGIDTSCYTTSLALCEESGRLLAERRRLLPVAAGSCGLRQSEALFAHIKQLPELAQDLFADTAVAGLALQAVCVSTRPRPQADSYMPVFRAGWMAAEAIAASHQAPCFHTSHQEGHLAAALAAGGLDWQAPFLALHLSGGTGEVLHAVPQRTGYAIRVLGEADLPPGQFIDRVGVALGLPFPAGPHLEALAEKAESTAFRLSGSVKGTQLFFSGPEAAAQRAIAAGVAPAEIAAAVLDNIGKSLAKVILAAREETGCEAVLLMGGVAANRRLRSRLAALDLTFAEAAHAGDNAFGVAVLGSRMLAAKAAAGGTLA